MGFSDDSMAIFHGDLLGFFHGDVGKSKDMGMTIYPGVNIERKMWEIHGFQGMRKKWYPCPVNV